MPEGDTVWRTARRLHQALSGQLLTTSDLRWPSLATTDLSGARTLEVVSRGKHILHRLDSGLTLHSHLRMDGQWRVQEASALARSRLTNPAIRAIVGSAQWGAIGSRLGMLDVVGSAEEGLLVGHLGPDVLGPDWDLERAIQNLRRPGNATIGAALLDQRNLAGVGTFYASESLFIERIDPWSSVESLTETVVERVVRRAHRLLDVNRHHAVQTTTGVSRRGQSAYVHSRSGQPCRRCGGGVRVAMIGVAPQDRTMFYCPRCQGATAPTDDGRAQAPLGSSRPNPGYAGSSGLKSPTAGLRRSGAVRRPPSTQS